MFEEVTCQDEDGNQYFEEATWSVGSCMHCACISGIMQCSREVSLVTFLENQPIGAVTFTQRCNQPECNVAKYMEKNAGVCHGKFPVAFVADQIFYRGTLTLTSADIDIRLPSILTFTGMLSTFDFLRRFRRSLKKFAYLTTKTTACFCSLCTLYKLARFVQAFSIFVHFAAVLVLSRGSFSIEDANGNDITTN